MHQETWPRVYLEVRKCTHYWLEQAYNFCAFPPFSLIPICLQNKCSGPCKRNSDHPGVAVLTGATAAMQSTPDNETLKEPTATRQPTSRPIAQQPAHNLVSPLSWNPSQCNVFTDITTTLMAPRRVGSDTKTIQNIHWEIVGISSPRRHYLWFNKDEVCLDFFITLHNQGLRCSISIQLDLQFRPLLLLWKVGNTPQGGSHPLMTQFFKDINELTVKQSTTVFGMFLKF